MLLLEVVPDSPAADAGLQANDIIVAFAGRDMLNGPDLFDAVAFVTPGSEVNVRWWRAGEFDERSVRLVERPAAVVVKPNRRSNRRSDSE